jgi:hypothetical protein
MVNVWFLGYINGKIAFRMDLTRLNKVVDNLPSLVLVLNWMTVEDQIAGG